MDMTNFAGTTNGSTREEQVYINNQWVTYRVRGFSAIPDGFFAPDTKTPYTDEMQLQYEVDLGNNMSVSATYYNRRTRDIFEDFDPGIYTDPAALRRRHQRAGLAVPRLGLLRVRSGQPAGRELLPRHAEGRQARLQRPRARLPQALLRQLAGAGVLQLPRCHGQHRVRRQRRLRRRRVLARSARAEHVGHVPGHDPPPVQGGRFVHDALGHRTRRHLPLELGQQS